MVGFWIRCFGVSPDNRKSKIQNLKCLFASPSDNRKSKIQNLKWMVVLASLFIAAMAGAGEAPKWKDEWQRVLDGAKKEGQLFLYGGLEITHPDILAAFNKEFPFLKLTTAAGRAPDLTARIVAE